MADITATKCDGCGKTTFDRYAEIGWLRFEGANFGGANISRSMGRGTDGVAVTDYLRGARDFCSTDCMKKALDREYDKRKKVETPAPSCSCAVKP